MEVDGVGVAGEVGDLPDLGGAVDGVSVAASSVSPAENALGSPARGAQELDEAALDVEGLVQGQLPDERAPANGGLIRKAGRVII